MPDFDVNTDAVVVHAAKLESLHKSAFPSAIRNTLNDASFSMKKDGLLVSAKDNFRNLRQPRFFKRYTAVQKASGFNVDKMKSIVGFLKPSNSAARRAIEGLKKHQFGGVIDDGSRYLKAARISSNYSKRVSRRNYYDKSKVITGRSKRRGTRKSKFVARMYRSKKENKPFFMNAMRGNFLAKTTSFRKTKNGDLKIKTKFLMMSRNKTPVTIKRNRFVSKAARREAMKMESYFRKNAEFQIKKYMK